MQNINDVSSETTLGASEFAAALNGDNPSAILQVLKRFTKTVRRERRIALAAEQEGDSDISDSESDDEDEDHESNQLQLQQPPTKKLKKNESWKEDTAAYHVPFVGTAVSRGDLAEVVQGQWPTGLLGKYLEKSPLAVELTGDEWIPSSSSPIYKSFLRRKQSRAANTLYKAYLKALTELVTAAIPMRVLREDPTLTDRKHVESEVSDEAKISPFLNPLLKKRLIAMFHLINDQTDKGRSKPGVYGGCGSLVPFVQRFLQSVAKTSVPNARLVCRYMDEELSEGVLRCILRPGPPPIDKSEDEKKDEKEDHRKTKPSRVEAIRLATVLLRTMDPAVATYICTSGSRERKVKPGILFCAFREGIAKHSQASRLDEYADVEDYFEAVSTLFENTRSLVESMHLTKAVGSKVLLDLFSRDPLYHLCDLSTYAPPMTVEHPFTHVLSAQDGDDEDDHDKPPTQCGREARRLLFILLGNPVKSPMLGNFSFDSHSHSMVNVILRLLQNEQAGDQTRRFSVYCMKVSPPLMAEFLRVISIPDASKEFDFMSSIRFVSMLFREGPTAEQSLATIKGDPLPNHDAAGIVSILWPLKFRRQAAGKAIQSSNPLVVLECIKFVYNALLRFQTLKSSRIVAGPLLAKVSMSFAQTLPDLQILLSVRSKHETRVGTKYTMLVTHALHLLLENYAAILPDQVRQSSFDWMKLLPEASTFLELPQIVQRKILSCLLAISRTCQLVSKSSVTAINAVLNIMVSTKDRVVFKTCREVATCLLLPVVESKSPSEDCLGIFKIELSWWLDAMKASYVSAFCNIVSLCQEKALFIMGRVGSLMAGDGEQKEFTWSILLMAAMLEGDATSTIVPMASLVATRSMLFQRNPIPFCNFLLSMKRKAGESSLLSSSSGASLVEYASTLVDNEIHGKTRFTRLTELIEIVFAPQHFFRSTMKALANDENCSILPNQTLRDAQFIIEAARFFLHISIAVGSSPGGSPLLDMTKPIIPALLLLCTTEDVHALADQALKDVHALARKSFSTLSPLLLSCPFVASIAREKTVDWSLSQRESRVELLKLPLLGQHPSVRDALTVQASLLDGTELGSRIAFALASTGDNQQRWDNICDCDCEVLERLVDVWQLLSTDQHNPGLCAYITEVFAGILKSNTLEGTFLLSLLTHDANDGAFNTCFLIQKTEPAHPEKNRLMRAHAQLLGSLLATDPLRFVPIFFARFSDPEFHKLPLWTNGIMDHTILEVVKSLTIDEPGEFDLSHLGNALMSRAIGLLESSKHESNSEKKANVVVLDLLTALLPMGLGTDDFPASNLMGTIAFYLSRRLEGPLVVNSRFTEAMCELSMNIWRERGNIVASEKSKTRCHTAVFYFVLGLFSHTVKSESLGKRKLHTLTCSKMTEFLSVFVESGEMFDGEIIGKISPSQLHKATKLALKYGVHDSLLSERISLSASLLKFVRQILVLSVEQGEGMLAHFDFPAVSELFQMVTTHSKFQSMLSTDRNNVESAADRIELIHLLRTCVESSPQTVSLDSHSWTIITSQFRAGLGNFDKEICRLLCVCSAVKIGVNVPYLDEIRWEGCSREPSRHGRRWDWLIDALDTVRIRETLNNFPTNETFDFMNLVVVSHQENVGNLEPADKEEYNVGDNPTVQFCNPGLVNDKLYNPAMILSLILGALHSCLPDENQTLSNDDGRGPDTSDKATDQSAADPQRGAGLVSMAKAFTEKGIHGLCLAALASPCEKVRAFSLSILGLLSEACSTEEARLTSSWRERPQIALLLNSVQRAFVVERAKAKDTYNCTENTIPTLSSLVATFLARSALSISKPDDPMYIPLNRFFLKADDDHGAFQDMNRLPGFIALYCATNDDPVQSRKERIWALHLISDGFVDEACYRLVSSCHAPELLLTSFENVHLSSFPDEMKAAEYDLLLDALTGFLNKGGRRAALHLISKVGLPSWLNSLCNTRPIMESFPLVRTQMKLCKLIFAAFQSIRRNENLLRDEVLDEGCTLTTPLLELWENAPRAKQDGTDHDIVQQIVLALGSFSDTMQKFSQMSGTPVFYHPLGLRLPQAMRCLSTVPTTALDACVPILCHIPCHIEPGDTIENSAAGELTKLLLEWLANRWPNDESNATITWCTPATILQRVLCIADAFGGNFGPQMNKKLTRILLSSKAFYQVNEESSLLWTECLELLSIWLSSHCVESRVASDILYQ